MQNKTPKSRARSRSRSGSRTLLYPNAVPQHSQSILTSVSKAAPRPIPHLIGDSPSSDEHHLDLGLHGLTYASSSPHPLLPLDLSPAWSSVCPAHFDHGLRTLSEAASNDHIRSLWTNNLPSIEVEDVGLESSLADRLIPFLLQPKNWGALQFLRGADFLAKKTRARNMYCDDALLIKARPFDPVSLFCRRKLEFFSNNLTFL